MLLIIIYLIQNEGDESFGGRRRLNDRGRSTAVFSVFFFSLKSVLDCSPWEADILNLQQSAATSATFL